MLLSDALILEIVVPPALLTSPSTTPETLLSDPLTTFTKSSRFENEVLVNPPNDVFINDTSVDKFVYDTFVKLDIDAFVRSKSKHVLQ